MTPPEDPNDKNSVHRRAGAQDAGLLSQINELTQQLGATASETQREAFRVKLGDLVAKQFDTRQARHKQEIQVLQAQVEQLKGLVQKRQENRTEIISRRVEQIIRDSQGLGF